MNELQADLETWIYEWVSVYNEKLQAVPCPFAKQAYVDNKILIRELKHIDTLTMPDYFASELENYTYHWPQDKEVVALGCKPNLIDSDELSDIVKRCNESFLADRRYIALEDHPDSLEIIAGEIMNQGEWALVLVQAKDKLDKASAILERQGYYKTWSQENLDDVVNWRKKS
jgi:hypothetical protein